MSNPYLGEIRMFGGNFAPLNWMFCAGQLLAISQYSALFSLIGTTYGGNGTTNFALPNLQSRIPVGQGQGPGLSNYTIGQAAGTESVTITTQTMPGHSHLLIATLADVSSPSINTNLLPGKPTAGNKPAFYEVPAGGTNPVTQPFPGTACSAMGNSLPHDNMMPSLCVTFIISLSGIFPIRN
jgi:microcystin-dependent protein